VLAIEFNNGVAKKWIGLPGNSGVAALPWAFTVDGAARSSAVVRAGDGIAIEPPNKPIKKHAPVFEQQRKAQSGAAFRPDEVDRRGHATGPFIRLVASVRVRDRQGRRAGVEGISVSPLDNVSDGKSNSHEGCMQTREPLGIAAHMELFKKAATRSVAEPRAQGRVVDDSRQGRRECLHIPRWNKQP
jgi:hypothetical protein